MNGFVKTEFPHGMARRASHQLGKGRVGVPGRKRMLFAATTIFGLSVIAQTSAIPPDIGSIIGNVGVLGALVWFMYYVTSIAQPRMLDKFTAEQKELREAYRLEAQAARQMFDAHLVAMRETFAKEQAAMRAAFAQEQAALRAAFADEQAKMRLHYGDEARQMRDLLAEALKGMRTAVHDVKDTANTAIQKSSAAELKARADAAKAGDSKHG